MKISDGIRLHRGVVSPSFIDLSTGRRSPFISGARHNTLSYMAAESVAAAFGGDTSFIPSRIGFIYGDKATMPTESVITRNQTWDGLVSELTSAQDGATVDIQIVGFSYSPTVGRESAAPIGGGAQESGSGSSGSSDQSPGGDGGQVYGSIRNAVTFHAVSNSQDSGILNGATFSDGSYIYQCVLLGYSGGEYRVIARASLKDTSASSGYSSPSGSGASVGVYLQKPSGFEIALDWTVVFR